MEECICDSGLPAKTCCEPILNGDKSAPTAEALMRSRYTAYVLGEIDYIRQTSTGVALDEFDAEESESFVKEAEFQGLDILRTEKGGADDKTGIVEFVFHYIYNEKEFSQREISKFVKEDGNWFFEDSEINPKGETITVDKVGRNDPCPCGSGKKYKKCCA